MNPPFHFVAPDELVSPVIKVFPAPVALISIPSADLSVTV